MREPNKKRNGKCQPYRHKSPVSQMHSDQPQQSPLRYHTTLHPGKFEKEEQPRPNLRSEADKKTRTNAKGPTRLTIVTYVSVGAVVAAVVVIVGLKTKKS